MAVASIAENLERVYEQIAQAASKVGHAAQEIELVAITKTHPAEKVREAIEAGQTLFGESRVQEARAKIPELPSNLHWHFVGHLQKNKIRHALPLFEMIHSVDSLAKFGFKPEGVRAKMESLLALPRLSIEGLMTIPPLLPEAEDSRKFFAQLRRLRDALEKEFDVRLVHLSMGMTNDFVTAVEEGATLVRIGTAIFGERSKK